MKNLFATLLFLNSLFFLSCNNLPAEKASTAPVEAAVSEDTAALQKLAGEWVRLDYSWEDSVLTFHHLADSSFQPQEMPSYNAYIFNAQTHTIETNIHGEPGCGLGAIQNKPDNSGWQLAGGLLHLRFQYNNNEGDHLINRYYQVERAGEILSLRQVK
jgi:hypothetical protein